MSPDTNANQLKWLLTRLGSISSDVRYQAYVDADGLDDRDFLTLVAMWKRPESRLRRFLGNGCLQCVLLIVVLILFRSSQLWMHYAKASSLLCLFIVACLVVPIAAYFLTCQTPGRTETPLARNLARLMRNRSDVRLLPHAVAMRESIEDEDTRAYLFDVYEKLLLRVDCNDANLLRKHEPVFAKVLLRPLNKISLTLAVLKAYEAAGSRKGLAYVRALAYVFEQDLQNWQEMEEQGRRRQREDSSERQRDRQREREIRRRIQDERDGNFGIYVPVLGHLDVEPKQQHFSPAPYFTPAGAEQLQQIITAARSCEQKMEQRLSQEENAMILLHPSHSPAIPSDHLLRPAGNVDNAPDELLRVVDTNARKESAMTNALTTIAPYKQDGVWMFDDERVGLAGEPFVSGADVMLDQLTRDLPNAEQGFTLLFSANPFPGYTVKLEWVREEYGGNWYRWSDAGLEGWFCPALFHYFPEAPKEIYARALS